MMSAVVARGTASAAAALGRPAAGKTGTTNDNTDAWFVGFTGRELGAVWIGFDDPVTKLGTQGDGAHAALPLWMRAIRAAEGTGRASRCRANRPRHGAVDDRPRDRPLLAPAHTGGLELWFQAGHRSDGDLGATWHIANGLRADSREF